MSVMKQRSAWARYKAEECVTCYKAEECVGLVVVKQRNVWD